MLVLYTASLVRKIGRPEKCGEHWKTVNTGNSHFIEKIEYIQKYNQKSGMAENYLQKCLTDILNIIGKMIYRKIFIVKSQPGAIII
jgi:hypothetical protein